MKWRSYEVELAVTSLFNIRQNLIIPNVSWGFAIHECDLLIVRTSGYVVEVEIKINLADLKNDFKKKHGHIDRQNRIKEFYYALPNILIEKATPIIEKHYEGAGIISCRYDSQTKWQPYRATLIKPALTNKSARKLELKERYQLARLGTLRLWNAKQALADRQLPIRLD